MNFHSGSPYKPKILILTPTGVTAINIDGTTINSGLIILPNLTGYTLARLSDLERTRLRSLYLEVSIFIIDQILIVSIIRLPHIHKRLCEIFGCP